MAAPAIGVVRPGRRGHAARRPGARRRPRSAGLRRPRPSSATTRSARSGPAPTGAGASWSSAAPGSPRRASRRTGGPPGSTPLGDDLGRLGRRQRRRLGRAGGRRPGGATGVVRADAAGARRPGLVRAAHAGARVTAGLYSGRIDEGRIGELAPLVFAAAGDGDAAARAIVDRLADEVVAMAAGDAPAPAPDPVRCRRRARWRRLPDRRARVLGAPHVRDPGHRAARIDRQADGPARRRRGPARPRRAGASSARRPRGRPWDGPFGPPWGRGTRASSRARRFARGADRVGRLPRPLGDRGRRRRRRTASCPSRRRWPRRGCTRRRSRR